MPMDELSKIVANTAEDVQQLKAEDVGDIPTFWVPFRENLLAADSLVIKKRTMGDTFVFDISQFDESAQGGDYLDDQNTGAIQVYP